MAIAKAAGYKKYYSAVGPDMAKEKAGAKEGPNHYSNNEEVVKVEDVVAQIGRYDDPKDEKGHLYGAILASLDKYMNDQGEGKYAAYALGFCSHYIGDLSQPLHNVPYDSFNKEFHGASDGVVEYEALDNILKIKENMYQIFLKKKTFKEDLAREITRIANISRDLGIKLKAENRNMKKEEAYAQLGHSASLFRAVLYILYND